MILELNMSNNNFTTSFTTSLIFLKMAHPLSTYKIIFYGNKKS